MSRLPNKTQKVFAGSLTASGNIAQPGSTALGTPVYSTDLDTIQALSAFLNGFSAQVVNGTASPVLQEFNAILLLLTQQVGYILENGIGAWNTNTTYYQGSLVTDGTLDAKIYRSLVDTNLGHALTDTNKWDLLKNTLIDDVRTAKAWVMFNGNTLALYGNFNASTITRLGTGHYLITFDTPLLYANYSYALTCNQGDSIGAIEVATRFPGDTKTTAAIEIRVCNTQDSSMHDVSEINLQVFAPS